MNQSYLETARLLTQVAPLVFVDDTFALKGGTAINLFIRDMPRLSVDLDLVFQDHALPRDAALKRIASRDVKGPHEGTLRPKLHWGERMLKKVVGALAVVVLAVVPVTAAPSPQDTPAAEPAAAHPASASGDGAHHSRT